jgi:hypothetical protein
MSRNGERSGSKVPQELGDEAGLGLGVLALLLLVISMPVLFGV